MSPIFKSSDRSKPESCRPVALQSMPTKFIESLVRDVLCNVPEIGKLRELHHGFERHKWSQTNLIKALGW